MFNMVGLMVRPPWFSFIKYGIIRSEHSSPVGLIVSATVTFIVTSVHHYCIVITLITHSSYHVSVCLSVGVFSSHHLFYSLSMLALICHTISYHITIQLNRRRKGRGVDVKVCIIQLLLMTCNTALLTSLLANQYHYNILFHLISYLYGSMLQ
jgi:hypothetical protein